MCYARGVGTLRWGRNKCENLIHSLVGWYSIRILSVILTPKLGWRMQERKKGDCSWGGGWGDAQLECKKYFSDSVKCISQMLSVFLRFSKCFSQMW